MFVFKESGDQPLAFLAQNLDDFKQVVEFCRYQIKFESTFAYQTSLGINLFSFQD